MVVIHWWKKYFYFVKSDPNSARKLWLVIVFLLLFETLISNSAFSWTNIHAKWGLHIFLIYLEYQTAPATLRFVKQILWTFLTFLGITAPFLAFVECCTIGVRKTTVKFRPLVSKDCFSWWKVIKPIIFQANFFLLLVWNSFFLFFWTKLGY